MFFQYIHIFPSVHFIFIAINISVIFMLVLQLFIFLYMIVKIQNHWYLFPKYFPTSLELRFPGERIKIKIVLAWVDTNSFLKFTAIPWESCWYFVDHGLFCLLSFIAKSPDLAARFREPPLRVESGSFYSIITDKYYPNQEGICRRFAMQILVWLYIFMCVYIYMSSIITPVQFGIVVFTMVVRLVCSSPESDNEAKRTSSR